MAKTVVGLYDDFHSAEQVVRDLEDNGFARENISLAARDQNKGSAYAADTDTERSQTGSNAAAGAGTGAVLGGLAGLLVGLGALAIPGIGPILAAGPLATALAGAGIGAVTGGLIGALTSAGVPEEEAHVYAEGVRRGGTLVMVNTPDDRANEAVDIMDTHNPVDVTTRAEQWRQQENWSRFDETAQPYTGAPMTRESRPYQTADREQDTQPRDFDREGETHIPIVEEEMRVGKRSVDRGGMRVRSYVTERPYEETQMLRDEKVNVERRPTDRPLAQDDLNAAFKEQSFEVTETGEELVTDKQAHVVEDVVISKSSEEHPETVRDTLRRTEVETENLGSGQSSRSSQNFDAFDRDFRDHYDTIYSTGGNDYTYYQPGYRYGYDLATNDRYRGRRWNEIEPEARREWERSHQNTPWDDFREAIRFGWQRATGSAQDTGPTSTGGGFRPENSGYEPGLQDNI